MPRFVDCFFSLLIVVSAVGLAPAQISAHSPKGADADKAAIHDFTLTMEKVNRYAAFSKKMQAAAGADPAMAAEMKKIEDTDVSVVEKAGLMEKAPHTAAFLKANGMTAREFVLVPMAVVTAGLATAAQDMKGKPPAFVNQANVQFVREHKAELRKLDLSGSSDAGDSGSNDKDPDSNP